MPQIVSGVDVTLRVEQGATPQATFGRGLCLENVTTVLTAEADVTLRRKRRVYSSAAAVKAAGESTALQEAANVWFAGTIEPQEFVAATQFGIAQPRMIYGDSFVVTEAEGLGDSYSITMGSRTITVDLDGLTTAAAVATALQTGLNAHANITGAVVTVIDTNRLSIQLPADLTGSVTFNDTADELGLGPDDTVAYHDGIATAETAADAMARILTLDTNFTLISLPTDAYNDISSGETKAERIEALASWAETNKRIFDFAVYGDTVLTDDETTSDAALQLALERRNVAYSFTGDDAGLLPVGNQTVLSAIRFTEAGTARNVANRTIPGVTPQVLTDTQAAELSRKRVNFYRKEGSLQHTRGGQTAGEWYETAYFLLWLENAVGLAGYNYSQALEAFIANDDDYAGLREVITVPLEQGVNAGFILPGGRVSTAVRNHIRRTTGNSTFNGVLEDGFLVWNAPAATATQAQLNARTSLPVYFWAKGAPMINDINISGNYAR